MMEVAQELTLTTAQNEKSILLQCQKSQMVLRIVALFTLLSKVHLQDKFTPLFTPPLFKYSIHFGFAPHAQLVPFQCSGHKKTRGMQISAQSLRLYPLMTKCMSCRPQCTCGKYKLALRMTRQWPTKCEQKGSL